MREYYIIFVPLLILMIGLPTEAFLLDHYQNKYRETHNCTSIYGKVNSVQYDDGWGNHNYVLNVDGRRQTSYQPYEVGEDYYLGENCTPK